MVRREGSAAAIRKFAASLGVRHPDREANIGLPQKSAQVAENNRQAFFEHDTRAVRRYSLDVAALKAAPPRVIPAGGSGSRGTWPYQCSVALADSLGTVVVEFPGNHAGFVDYPLEFAERLHECFGRQ